VKKYDQMNKFLICIHYTDQTAQVVRCLLIWREKNGAQISYSLPATRHRCKFKVWALA